MAVDFSANVIRDYWEAPPSIEVDVSPEVLAVLLDRTSKQWQALGESDPYWSVLTADEYRIGNLTPETISGFYETGRPAAELINRFEQKTGARTRRGVCFELGCGVGRVTQHLAPMFEHVIAADISPGNLFRCGEWMEKKGIANVTTLLLTSPDQLGNIAHFDFLYSVIVLQHNAPPVQKILLDKLLPKINSDGCLFQTPDNLPNYSYSATDHLNSTLAVMDSHCLPKPVVLRLLHEHGLQVRDVQMDPWNGNWGSYTYFATR